jgi:hypothetical protein
LSEDLLVDIVSLYRIHGFIFCAIFVTETMDVTSCPNPAEWPRYFQLIFFAVLLTEGLHQGVRIDLQAVSVNYLLIVEQNCYSTSAHPLLASGLAELLRACSDKETISLLDRLSKCQSWLRTLHEFSHYLLML